jgi:hypothetical protein
MLSPKKALLIADFRLLTKKLIAERVVSRSAISN